MSFSGRWHFHRGSLWEKLQEGPVREKFDGFSLLFSGLVLATVGVSACGEGAINPRGDTESRFTALCLEVQGELSSWSPRDGIPALTDPSLVPVGDPMADYLHPTDRVIGLEVFGQYIAIPHNILWWHEIVNLNDFDLAVTYCPLTGSSMVFHRFAVDGAEFGVSGLLFNNNLVMYDRAAMGREETLWLQMAAGGRCGPGEGRELDMFPSIELEWEDWVALHPDTRVVSKKTGFSRLYRRELYPYGDYEKEDNPNLLSAQSDIDLRRPPKERLLGIPFGDGGGIAFPFGALRSVGDLAAIHETLGDGQEGAGNEEPVVVFWDSGAAAATAYRPRAGGQDLTFEVRDGAFVDLETGSQWSIEGKVLSGPLAGARLQVISEAYVSFWFAFSTFFPNPELWLP